MRVIGLCKQTFFYPFLSFTFSLHLDIIVCTLVPVLVLLSVCCLVGPIWSIQYLLLLVACVCTVGQWYSYNYYSYSKTTSTILVLLLCYSVSVDRSTGLADLCQLGLACEWLGCLSSQTGNLWKIGHPVLLITEQGALTSSVIKLLSSSPEKRIGV